MVFPLDWCDHISTLLANLQVHPLFDSLLTLV